ncbi:zinc ribbon domain-containing protein [Bradyrhizobium elkanii]
MKPRERVRAVLDKRNATKLRRDPRDFPFSGLMNCGHCGCAFVGELHKGRYIYYHCTGYKGKCSESYVRTEVIAAKFPELMGRPHFSEKVHQWIVAGLHQQSGLVLKGRGGPSVCAFLTRLSLN